MEIKQMQYLVKAVECKSLNKAADVLYTTQPNVSKVIQKLEAELKSDILIRTSKGISLTEFGEQVYMYAKNMLKNVDMIEKLGEMSSYYNLKIASYPSNMVARNLSKFYIQAENERVHIEFREGTAENVIHWVQRGQANIGILYIVRKQEALLNQVLKIHNLKFQLLKECEICLYVGPRHPYYNTERIEFEELKNLRFVQSTKDYFGMEEYLDWISYGAIRNEELKHIVHTNSDHCMLDMLLYTDLVSMGPNFMNSQYDQYDIHAIKINHCERYLLIGYVLRDSHNLMDYERSYIESLEELYQMD